MLQAKAREEKRTDEMMSTLMEHPLVKDAIKKAVKQLLTQGKWEAS